jgi:hypothetical protein
VGRSVSHPHAPCISCLVVQGAAGPEFATLLDDGTSSYGITPGMEPDEALTAATPHRSYCIFKPMNNATLELKSIEGSTLGLSCGYEYCFVTWLLHAEYQ